LARSIVGFLDYKKIEKEKEKGELIIYLTDIPPEFEKIARNFLGFSPEKVMRVAPQE